MFVHFCILIFSNIKFHYIKTQHIRTLLYKEMSTFLPIDSFTPCQICTKLANLVLCDID